MTRRLKILPTPLRAIAEPAELFDAIERDARVGVWRRFADSAEMEWSDNVYRLFGYEPGERPATVESAAERMHRVDAQRLRAELERPPDDGPSPLMRHRVVLPDGSLRVLEGRPAGGWRRDESGRPVLVGTLRDVTEELTAARASAWRRALEELFRDWDAPSADRANHVLGALARALDADAAALWCPDSERLVPSAYWAASELSGDGLSRAFEAFSGRKGAGLAGGAWESGEVAVLLPGTTLPEAARFLPGRLRPVVAVPAVRADEVLAVVVFYGRACLEGAELLREELSASRATLGVVLGHHLRVVPRSPLTTRELEVLQLAADGLGGQDIERRLRLSRSTVKSHFENIYGKLGVRNRPAAVARALRAGVIV